MTAIVLRAALSGTSAGESGWSERALIVAALQLGAAGVSGWSRAESALASRIGAGRVSNSACAARAVEELRDRIQAGDDPLGSAYIALRTRELRRATGATYTPGPIVRSMFTWARAQRPPQRIIDPGTGSGRFLMHAAQVFRGATLVGIEIDPLAAMIARANLAAMRAAPRARVEVGDYRRLNLRSPERTLFIGNPPYVRHHLIDGPWKEWFAQRWRRFGIEASRRAGLHVHFFLATLLNGREGDLGAFITSAEWLDVNYGSSLRKGLLGLLGAETIITVAPTVAPFPDAKTTAAITLFRIGSRNSHIRVRRVRNIAQLSEPARGRLVSRGRFESAGRWSPLICGSLKRPPGLIELGEICSVHRGQATGANGVWIAGEIARHLPARVLFPTVTRARELIDAGRVLRRLESLRKVVDIPESLDEFDARDRRVIESFLAAARKCGADASYLARHRRAWWSVALRAPAPVLATYMARRPPVFTYNPLGARHLNIAHGLYPHERLTEAQLLALVDHLSGNASVADGRTYAGGLTKFEPREMERLLVPRP